MDKKRILEDMGYRCKTIRKEAGLTQQQVASELGISRITISDFERGKNDSYTLYQYYIDKLYDLVDREWEAKALLEQFPEV